MAIAVINPATGETVRTFDPLLISGMLAVVSRQQIGEVAIVNIPSMKLRGGRSLEGVRRRFTDEDG